MEILLVMPKWLAVTWTVMTLITLAATGTRLYYQIKLGKKLKDLPE